MQHKIVTDTLIFIHETFRPYTATIRCIRYAKLFTALLNCDYNSNNSKNLCGFSLQANYTDRATAASRRS
jgi:hypothetical protein